jgi:hypothetical protein
MVISSIATTEVGEKAASAASSVVIAASRTREVLVRLALFPDAEPDSNWQEGMLAMARWR